MSVESLADWLRQNRKNRVFQCIDSTELKTGLSGWLDRTKKNARCFDVLTRQNWKTGLSVWLERTKKGLSESVLTRQNWKAGPRLELKNQWRVFQSQSVLTIRSENWAFDFPSVLTRQWRTENWARLVDFQGVAAFDFQCVDSTIEWLRNDWETGLRFPAPLARHWRVS